jgi:hypothetical protein
MRRAIFSHHRKRHASFVLGASTAQSMWRWCGVPLSLRLVSLGVRGKRAGFYTERVERAFSDTLFIAMKITFAEPVTSASFPSTFSKPLSSSLRPI